MSEQQLPTRLVFRVPQVSILAALLVAICATPMAAALPVLAVIYVIPVAAIVWVVRVRTVADASGLTVRKIAGSADVAWDDLKGLLLNPKGTVTAVRKDDTRLPLPSVRTRHLPALSVISGGRITDPTDTTGPPPLPGGTALGQSTGGEGSEDHSSTGEVDPAEQKSASAPE
ncbi:PH domain-containing protein [Actinokineospora soli]